MNDIEKPILKYTLFTGMALGAAVDIIYALGPYTGFKPTASSVVVPAIIGSSALLQILTATASSYLFGRSIISWKIKPFFPFLQVLLRELS